MKIYLADIGYMFDSETQETERIPSEREAIQRVVIAPEDCIVKSHDSKINAEKDDLIITFYDGSFKHKYVVLKSKEWLENIVDYNERQKSAQVKQVKICGDCEACDCACCK